MRRIAQMFKALAEETRLEILALLFRHGEICGCDVEEVLGVTQSKASRHLRYLLGAGLVEDRRDGLWIRYRVVEHPTARQQTVLAAARSLLTDEVAASVEARYQDWLRRKGLHPPVRVEFQPAPCTCGAIPVAGPAAVPAALP
jgi:ArsR family transcriptional regulator, arsenate/arsenite/antimonite-responsive transcriptional repressor